MIKRTFHLVSNWFKVLAIFLTIFLSCVSAVITIYNPVWYAVLFLWLSTCFCAFATVICFLNKIVVNLQKKQILVYTLTRRKIDMNELQSIDVDISNSVDSKRYCHIVFKLNDGSIFKIPGFTTIIRSRAVDDTRNLINSIIAYLHK